MEALGCHGWLWFHLPWQTLKVEKLYRFSPDDTRNPGAQALGRTGARLHAHNYIV